MPITMTPEQEKEVKNKGYAAKPAYDEVSNRRYYYDPRKDEKGNVMGWTRPLPGDPLRLNYYLRHGFLLQDPEGNMAPPPGYFRKRMPQIKTPAETHEIGSGNGEIQKIDHEETAPSLKCPICLKDFPDTDTLVHHMIYHRSKTAKVKSRAKSKRGRSKNK